ncbi:MAG: response regulator transcription factor [Flavobacteriia bacterium]|nr:response regulator transcription factor [Flavobacteriia bacterium]
MKILFIEDEIKMAQSISLGLKENGFMIDLSFNGEEGLQLALSNKYDLIISDIILPEKNGVEICKIIRNSDIQTPILFLTALGTTDDKIIGLESGADDYLVKPFEFKELLARINALHRRSTIQEKEKSNLIKVKDLELDLDKKTVKRNQKNIDLTAREFDLVVYFIENINKVVSKKEIAENVWDIHFDTGTNIIEVYVNYLRKKIDKDFEDKLIQTIHGRGYILRA